MLPLDDAHLCQYVPWMMRPLDQCVLTQGRIDVLVKIYVLVTCMLGCAPVQSYLTYPSIRTVCPNVSGPRVRDELSKGRLVQGYEMTLHQDIYIS
jgi:hypothetical protein